MFSTSSAADPLSDVFGVLDSAQTRDIFGEPSGGGAGARLAETPRRGGPAGFGFSSGDDSGLGFFGSLSSSGGGGGLAGGPHAAIASTPGDDSVFAIEGLGSASYDVFSDVFGSGLPAPSGAHAVAPAAAGTVFGFGSFESAFLSSEEMECAAAKLPEDEISTHQQTLDDLRRLLADFEADAGDSRVVQAMGQPTPAVLCVQFTELGAGCFGVTDSCIVWSGEMSTLGSESEPGVRAAYVFPSAVVGRPQTKQIDDDCYIVNTSLEKELDEKIWAASRSALSTPPDDSMDTSPPSKDAELAPSGPETCTLCYDQDAVLGESAVCWFAHGRNICV
nr:hypothetical protein HK105_007953 [Polyrhizophydium stewartii]